MGTTVSQDASALLGRIKRLEEEYRQLRRQVDTGDLIGARVNEYSSVLHDLRRQLTLMGGFDREVNVLTYVLSGQGALAASGEPKPPTRLGGPKKMWYTGDGVVWEYEDLFSAKRRCKVSDMAYDEPELILVNRVDEHNE